MRRPVIAFIVPLLVGAALGAPAYLLGAAGPALSIAVYAGELAAALVLIRAWTGAHAVGLNSLGATAALGAGIAFALARGGVWLAVIPIERVELSAVAVTGVAYALIVAVAEEVHFRGLVMATLVPRIGARGAIVLAASLFALVHVAFGVMWLPLFAADGLVWGALRMRGGALAPVILSHAVLNFLTSTVLIAPRTVDDVVAASYLALAVAVDALALVILSWPARHVAQRSVA